MIKKLVGLILVVGTLFSILSVSANASYNSFFFDVNPDVKTGKAWSSYNYKDDNDQYAHVETESHNLNNSDEYFYRVMCSPDTKTPASVYYQVSPQNAKYIAMQYYDGYAWKGAKRYLMADTDKYFCWSRGYWWS